MLYFFVFEKSDCKLFAILKMTNKISKHSDDVVELMDDLYKDNKFLDAKMNEMASTSCATTYSDILYNIDIK